MNYKYHDQQSDPEPGKLRRGSALMVSMALLVMLTIIAVTMVRVSQTEHTISERDALQTRAEFLARSGIEQALNRNLMGRQGMYLGEDWDGNGKNTARVRLERNLDELGNDNGALDYRLDPKYALRPSFFVPAEEQKHPQGTPALMKIRGENNVTYRGYSGELPSSVPGGRETYSTAVVDNNTKLNINSLNPHIAEVIDVLYQEITGQKKFPGTERIFPNRPEVTLSPSNSNRKKTTFQGGYTSVKELRKKNILTNFQYRILKDYLTVPSRTWVDTSVVKPSPQDPYQSTDAPPTDPESAFPYQFDYTLQPRAPINVNRAVKPVLTAVISGLSARVVGTQHISASTDGKARYRTTEINPIKRKEARKIADAIIRYRRGNLPILFRGESKHKGPFRTWEEFEAFVEQELINEKIISRSKGYLLKSHFNPNTRFSKLNPDATGVLSWDQNGRRLFIDKTDFTYHTTEFSFYSGGFFEVRAHGRIQNADHEVIAESSRGALLRKYRLVRHTTQRDFLISSNTDETHRVKTHPESEADVPKPALETGYRSGSVLDGSITLGSPYSNAGHHSWNFQETNQQRSSPSPLSSQMSPTLPSALWNRGFFEGNNTSLQDILSSKGGSSVNVSREYERRSRSVKNRPAQWRSKEWPVNKSKEGSNKDGNYQSFSEQSGVRKEPYGAAAGKTVQGRFGKYPFEDPFWYSDVTPGGVLSRSDRNRLIRFSTGESSMPRNSWERGHVEFWWKPKQPLSLKDHSSSSGVQYTSSGYHLTLFEQWFLAESARIQVPHYNNVKFDDPRSEEWADFLWLLYYDPTYKINVDFLTRKLPGDVQFIQDTPGNAAGYFMDFWLQDGTWYFLVRFRSIFDPQIDGWEGRPRNTIQAGEYLGGAVLAELPAEGAAAPKPGKWNHIVLQWKPMDHTFHYYMSPADKDRIYLDSRTKRLIGGKFWINGKKASDHTFWGEGNIRENEGTLDKVYVSNLATAERDGITTMGQTGAGWPPSWYEPGELFPNHIGPNRLEKYPSYGHIGARVRPRGPRGAPEKGLWPEPPQNYSSWWQKYAEGTIGAAYMTSNPGNARYGSGIHESRYYKSSGWSNSPHFSGQIRRKTAVYWEDRQDDLGGYHKQNQHVFQGSASDRVEILGFAHTQYTPDTDYDGSRISNGVQPAFRFFVRKENDHIPAPSDWQGSYLPADQFLDGDMRTLHPSEDTFRYRLQPINCSRSPQNVTPHFDDLTVFYRLSSDQYIRELYTYKPN